MKSSSSSSLPLTLPFLLFAINFASAAFMDPPVMILDQDGVPVSASAEYYVAQFNGGQTGGGLTTGLGSNITCPLIVLQVYDALVNGQKVKFTTRGTKSDDKIRTGTPLDIEFVDKPSCASSSKWVVVDDSKYPGQWLGIGDAADLPGKKIIDGVFKIEKYSFLEGYKFTFCPTARNVCLNFARLEDKNGRRLILVNETSSPIIFEVGFDKAVTSSNPLF
ncbi:hypothetical protein VNO80_12740 [Phaseolus coccineus]|uniref:Uncharacterized protein n=1 Tax=Phaseolus coccineus TaxID=3886 RepID=A0AAN9RF44_PHACN